MAGIWDKVGNVETLPPGMSPKAYNALVAVLAAQRHTQAVAATLAATVIWVAEFDGALNGLEVVLSALPAAGESMVYDVLKNGVSILSATFTADATTATEKVVDLMGKVTVANMPFKKGDKFTVARTYVAGGGPAMVNNNVVLFPGKKISTEG